MINKNEFVRQWFRSNTEEKLALGQTFKVSTKWDYTKSDPYIKTFLGTLAELVVLKYLDLNYPNYELGSEYQDFIYQIGDNYADFKGKSDLTIYSTRKEKYVPTEIKSTAKWIVEGISNTLVIPEYLITKSEEEKARFMIIIDGLGSWSRDITSKDYGKLKSTRAHIIFYDMESKQGAILADTAYVNKLIEEILYLNKIIR